MNEIAININPTTELVITPEMAARAQAVLDAEILAHPIGTPAHMIAQAYARAIMAMAVECIK